MNIIKRLKQYIHYRYSVYSNKNKHLKILEKIENPIFIDGHPDSKNFGDALNVFLVEYLSGKNVFPSKFISNSQYKDEVSYSVIGSVCQWTRENSVVWGSGFIDEKYLEEQFVKPNNVMAVRGPLTRNIYLKQGVECPEVYGDPALLLPLIYNPEIEKKYEVGIIPHYTEIDSEWVKVQRKNKDILFVDIMINSDYQTFVKQIKSCKRILTSSLHGLILCHAYKIPVCHIKLSNNLTGGSFKFNDYLLSVGKPVKEGYEIKMESALSEKLDFDSEPITYDIKPLINSCPFINEDIKKKLLIESSYYEGT